MPVVTYLEVGAAAEADGLTLNAKLNQLVNLGLGKHVSLDAALRRLIHAEVVTPDMTVKA